MQCLKRAPDANKMHTGLCAALLVLFLSGCATLQQPTTLRLCAAADVATTVVAVKTHAGRELNPLWKASVNDGRFLPFVLATVLAVILIERLDRPAVTATAAAVECGLAAHNVWILR